MKKIISALVFCASVFVFYGFHPGWINFHEQYQMFLFGAEYFIDRFSVASGLSSYIAEFLVQFFYYPLLGSAVWALFLTALGLLVGKLYGIFSKSDRFNPFAYIVPILAIVYCEDLFVMPTFMVSLTLSLLAVWGYFAIRTSKRIYSNIILIPLVYWICGYNVLVYIILVAFGDCISGVCDKLKALTFFFLGVLLYVFTAFLAAYTSMRQYPMIDIFIGYNFYRVPLQIPVFQHVVALSPIVVILFSKYLFSFKRNLEYVYVSIVVLVMVVAAFTTYKQDFQQTVYVDYLVRHQRWNRIIRYFEKHTYNDYTCCTALHLALAMTNQLPDRQFEFVQAGHGGLFAPYTRNLISAVSTGEVFYNLGMINQSLRIAFDSQEAIPNYNKSGRFCSRIAEGYMFSGRKEMALKYTDMLKHTLFYSKFAKEIEAALYNPELIKSNPQWSKILEYRIPKDGFCPLDSYGDFLLQLYKHCPKNKLALQYSLAIDLSNRDMNQFSQNFPLYQDSESLRIPKVYQEALAFMIFQQTHSSVMPPYISPKVQKDFVDFCNNMNVGQNSPALHQGPLSKTFWHYAYFGNN